MFRRTGQVEVRRDEPSSPENQPARPLDLLEVIAAGISDDDVVRLVFGQGVADAVEGVGQARAADDVGGPAGFLAMQEFGRRQGRGVES